MAETKTIQKGWRFSPQTIEELTELCEREKRSETNMVEVLIERAYQNLMASDLFKKIKENGAVEAPIVQSGPPDVRS